jgi:hypothetical protein
MIDYLLLIFLFEPYRVRHSSCSFDDLIDNIVTDRTIFKTDNVDHAIRLYGVFYWKLFVKFLRGLEVLRFFGLTDTDIGQSIGHDDSKVRGKWYIWLRSWRHLLAIPKQNASAGVIAVCPSASALVRLLSNFSPISWIEDNEICSAASLPASRSYSKFFLSKFPTTLQCEKLSTGY